MRLLLLVLVLLLFDSNAIMIIAIYRQTVGDGFRPGLR